MKRLPSSAVPEPAPSVMTGPGVTGLDWAKSPATGPLASRGESFTGSRHATCTEVLCSCSSQPHKLDWVFRSLLPRASRPPTSQSRLPRSSGIPQVIHDPPGSEHPRPMTCWNGSQHCLVLNQLPHSPFSRVLFLNPLYLGLKPDVHTYLPNLDPVPDPGNPIPVPGGVKMRSPSGPQSPKKGRKKSRDGMPRRESPSR